MTADVLEVREVIKQFGGVRALDGVSIDVPADVTTALIGPNGSGKTTLFNIISGFSSADGGSVLWGGRRVDGLSPRRMVARGVVRTFQQRMLFDRASVAENIRVAGLAAGLRGDELASAVSDCLTTFSLGAWAAADSSKIPFGVARRVAVGAATMVRPKLLLLDEPAAGLSDEECAQLNAALQALIRRGVGIFVVDHNMDFIAPLCDRVIVLNNGNVIADGGRDVLTDPEVVRAYLD